MKMRVTSFVAAAAIAAAWPVAASAQQQNTAPGQTAAGKTLDPNEVVCERHEETGSRLASKRICMTRAQWADLRSQDRQETERVQVQRGTMAPH